MNWDGAAKTITLSSPRVTAAASGTPDTAAKGQQTSVQMRPDFTIVVEGVKRTFTDAKGNAVYPMLYSGTNYLPVRAIGDLMDKEMRWNGAAKTITLSGGSLVTDADSFNPTPGTTTPSSAINIGSYIGEEKAKQTTLSHAGLSASQVTFTKAKLDRDDGRQVYDVEFRYGTMEYEYEINAYTGAVLSKEAESIYD